MKIILLYYYYNCNQKVGYLFKLSRAGMVGICCCTGTL